MGVGFHAASHGAVACMAEGGGAGDTGGVALAEICVAALGRGSLGVTIVISAMSAIPANAQSA